MAHRFLAIHAAVRSAFWVACHRLKAFHHRLWWEQHFSAWKLATCVSQEKAHESILGNRHPQQLSRHFHRQSQWTDPVGFLLVPWRWLGIAQTLCGGSRLGTQGNQSRDVLESTWATGTADIARIVAVPSLVNGDAAMDFQLAGVCPGRQSGVGLWQVEAHSCQPRGGGTPCLTQSLPSARYPVPDAR